MAEEVVRIKVLLDTEQAFEIFPVYPANRVGMGTRKELMTVAVSRVKDTARNVYLHKVMVHQGIRHV